MKIAAIFKSLFVLLLLSASQSFAQNIGIEFYTFRDQFAKDVPGTLEMIHKMGIREVEMGGTYGLPEAEFKQLLRKNQLEVIGVACGF
jgi:hypothetical protein